MIRQATLEDLETVLDLCEEMHSEANVKELTVNRDKARDFVAGLINTDRFVALIEVDGKSVGIGLGDLISPWYTDELIGYDYLLYTLPTHRHGRHAYRLLSNFVQWCKDNGAKQIRPAIGAGNNNGHRLLEAIGFKAIGANFLMEI